MKTLVSQLTPQLKIDSIDVIVANQEWRLNVCRTYWAMECMPITIDGEDYLIKSFEFDKEIVITGSVTPTATAFTLAAPKLYHGSRRKVNKEMSQEDDLRYPFVYLPRPVVREDNRVDSDIAYLARVRPIFIADYLETKDTTEEQQDEIIEPMNEMADLFIWLVEDQLDKFNEPSANEREEWMNFGDPNVWGNDELIFNRPCSGVELRLEFDVLRDFACECDGEPPNVCPDVTSTFNGTITDFSTNPGGNIAIIVQDPDENLVGTLIEDTPNTKRIEITGGGALPVTTEFNAVPTLVDTPSGQNLEIAVLRASSPALIGTLVVNTPNSKGILVGDCDITFNSVPMLGAPPEFAINYKIVNQGGVEIGSQKNSTEWEVDTDNDIPVHYVRPPLLDMPSSGQLYDEKWHFDNGTFDYAIPSGTIPQELDPTNPDMLRFNNVWGHKFRFVGINGGYYNPSDGNYYDKDGVLSDRDTVFKLSGRYYIIDEYTGLGWDGQRGGQIDWAGAVNTGAVTIGGFNDFYLPTRDQFWSILRHDVLRPLYLTDRPPFDIQLTQWTCTPSFSNPMGSAYGTSLTTAASLFLINQALLRTRSFVRAHYT